MSTAPLQNPSTVPFSLSDGLQASIASELENQIAKVRAELKEWHGKSESRLEQVSDSALRTAWQLAREMFGAEPRLLLEADPEAADFPYFSISVCRDSQLSVRESIQLQLAWCERVHPLFAGPFDYPRLLAYSK